MNSKSFFHFAILMPLLSAVSVLAADDLPKPMSFARYDPMIEHSPFAVATAVAPVAAAPDFAKDLFIANAAKSPDGDLVTLQSSSDRNFKEYLTTKAAVHGFSISNIEWSDRVGATKVTISKNGQFATLSFNEALVKEPIQNAGSAAGQANPGVGMVPQANPIKFPQPVQAAQAAPIIPTYPTPVPRVPGPIQRRPMGNKWVDPLKASALQATEAQESKEEK